jgi:hypothetical protein
MGATGATGPAGPAQVIVGGFIYQGFGSPNSTFFPISSAGDATEGGGFTDFNSMAAVMPVSCTIDIVRVFQPSASGGTTLTVKLFKASGGTGTPTSVLTLTVANGSNVPSTGNSISVSAGDTLAFQLSGGNTGSNSGNIILNTGLHCQ